MYICYTKYIEMGKEYLGEFEELVLTMVGILKDEAYGNGIVNEIRSRLRPAGKPQRSSCNAIPPGRQRICKIPNGRGD